MFQPARLLIIGLLLLFSACTGSSGDSLDSSVETAAAATVSDGGTSPTKSEGTSQFAPHIQTVSTLTNCLFLHNRWVSAVAFHKVFTEKRLHGRCGRPNEKSLRLRQQNSVSTTLAKAILLALLKVKG